MGVVIRFAVTFVAVFVTSLLVPNMLRYDSLGSLALFAGALALINAFVRPIVMLLTCPIQLLTLGLASLLINALLFMFAAGLVPGVEVGNLLNAFVAALIVSLVSWAISLVVRT